MKPYTVFFQVKIGDSMQTHYVETCALSSNMAIQEVKYECYRRSGRTAQNASTRKGTIPPGPVHSGYPQPTTNWQIKLPKHEGTL